MVLQCFTWIFERAYRQMQLQTLGSFKWGKHLLGIDELNLYSLHEGGKVESLEGRGHGDEVKLCKESVNQHLTCFTYCSC